MRGQCGRAGADGSNATHMSLHVQNGEQCLLRLPEAMEEASSRATFTQCRRVRHCKIIISRPCTRRLWPLCSNKGGEHLISNNACRSLRAARARPDVEFGHTAIYLLAFRLREPHIHPGSLAVLTHSRRSLLLCLWLCCKGAQYYFFSPSSEPRSLALRGSAPGQRRD